MVIDLTYSWRYYDPAEFHDFDVQHMKVRMGVVQSLAFNLPARGTTLSMRGAKKRMPD